MKAPKFTLGKCVMTPGAQEALAAASQDPLVFLTKHVCGDWGLLDAEDAEANEAALKDGLRLLSVYETRLGTRLWVITEHDRSVTTILLPDEY